ncbi:Hsp20/alpha crystallin family protein [Myxococcota bacterium]|nr:Hsp20/alpha crystallin family protein [Myxococcota bacterium]MBU1432886.1 Hsp20/alpha crystallin family protein [Myxococcota bacterium]
MSESNKVLRVLRPNVDIFENQDGLLLRADMPGVRQEAMDLQVEKGLLTLLGQRQVGEGVFEYRRRFQVPRDIDPSKITATMRRGVLELNMPRAEVYKPRKIEISAEA